MILGVLLLAMPKQFLISKINTSYFLPCTSALNLWNSYSIIIAWLPFWGGLIYGVGWGEGCFYKGGGGGHTPGNLLFTQDSSTTTLNLFLYLNMYLDICILASDYLTSVIVHCLMTCQASPCSFKLICHILRVLSFDPVANHLPSGENAQQTTYLEINAPTQGDEPQSFTQQTFKGPSVTTTWFISEQIKDKTTEGIFFAILLIPRTFQFRKLNWRALKIWQTLWDMTRVES